MGRNASDMSRPAGRDPDRVATVPSGRSKASGKTSPLSARILHWPCSRFSGTTPPATPTPNKTPHNTLHELGLHATYHQYAAASSSTGAGIGRQHHRPPLALQSYITLRLISRKFITSSLTPSGSSK